MSFPARACLFTRIIFSRNYKMKVCLTMIVKNEEHIVERALKSILPYITTYSICDTGSTDKTKEVIKSFMTANGIDGVIHDCKWVNFGVNRTISLQKAREHCPDGYAWVLDADDTVEGEFNKEILNDEKPDGFMVTIKQGTTLYNRVQIFRCSKDWIYERALHEYAALKSGQPVLGHLPPTIWNNSNREGARSKDAQKYRKDAEVLCEELSKYPNDPRTLFYLAQSWRDAGNKERAIKYYRRRAELKNGWEQEKYVALQNLIELSTNLNEKIELGWKAVDIDPTRIEAPFIVMRAAKEKKIFTQQVLAMALVCSNRQPKSTMLFANTEMYQWGYDVELSMYAYFTGHLELSVVLGQRALQVCPENLKPALQQRLEIAMQESGRTFQSTPTVQQPAVSGDEAGEEKSKF